MIRRTHPARALAAVTLAGVLAGCSTFTDNADAARVGDVELSQDDFDALLVAATPGATLDEPVDVSGDTARQIAFGWVATEVVKLALDESGRPLTDDDRRAATEQLQSEVGDGWDTTPEALRELQVEQRAAIDAWTAQLEEQPVDEEALRADYDQGIEASGIACTAHILVATEAEAQAVADELADGADFATLAAERSTDTGSAANGGVLPCSSAGQFTAQYVPEYVDAALAATVGEPTAPVASEFGYHVILVRPFDDASAEIVELAQSLPFRFARQADQTDVHVDPRIGTFDPVLGVTALG